MTDTLAVALFPAIVVGGLVGLHFLDRYITRLEQRERADRRKRQREGKAPAAPGTMRRRYSDLTEPGDDGDMGGVPQWPDRAA